MIRNLKALGLALVAISAMSAIGASGASAQTPGLITVGTATTITGTEIAGKQNSLTALGQAIQCPESTYDVFKYNVTPHVSVPDKATTVTVKPTYNNPLCKTAEGIKMTFNTNSCDLVFHVGETTPNDKGEAVPGTYGVTEDIECSTVGDAIDVEIYLSASNENIKACTIKITQQTGLTGEVHLTNGTTSGGKKDVTLEGTFTNIHVEETGLCGTNTTNEAVFHVAVTITGKDVGGSPTDISISD